jgi:UDPglucose 6-dehydrogenase
LHLASEKGQALISSEMKNKLKDAVIFDGRNLYETDEMNEKGFYYSSIGRQLIQQ